ncbi:MAG: O-antigen ligase family protein [Pseudomonadota bacterium]
MSADSAYQRQNILFTVATLAPVAAIGSGVTILVVLSLYWNIFLMVTGAMKRTLPTHQRAMVIIFTQFAVIGFALSRLHDGSKVFSGGSEYLLFLAPIVLLPRYGFGPPKQELRAIMLRALAGAGMIAGLLTTIEFMIWGGRAAAVPGNPLILAPVACMAGLGTLAMLVEPPVPRDRLWAVIGWLGALIAIVLSQSRTITVLFLACSAFFGVLNWRLAARNLHRHVFISGVAVAVAGSLIATFAVVDRLVTEPPLAVAGEPSSAQWRLVYADAGWRVASENLMIGVGRDQRAIAVGAELQAMSMPTRVQETTHYKSWHRWIPEPARSYVINWQIERWEEQTADAQANGAEALPPRPVVEKETRTVLTSPHQHLHNAYMTMLVDHGVVGLVSLLLLMVGPIGAGFRNAIHKSDPVLFNAYCVIIVAVALSGLTNLHIENDIIASYFIVISMSCWAVFRLPDDSVDHR